MKRHFVFLILLMMISGCKLRPAPSEAPLHTAPDENPGQEHTDVLFYGGPGSWGDENDALKQILYDHGKTYAEADEDQINSMTDEEIEMYSLILVPGGDSDKVTN